MEYIFVRDVQTTVPDPGQPDKCYFFPKGSIADVEWVGSIHFKDDEGEWEIPLEQLEGAGFVLKLDMIGEK